MNDVLRGPGWYVCRTEGTRGGLRVAGVLEKCENKAAAEKTAAQYTESGVMALYRDAKEVWHRENPAD